MISRYSSGTDNRGQSDEWYGDTDNDITKYSPKDVRLSQAGVTFNALKTKLQVKRMMAGTKEDITGTKLITLGTLHS